MSDTVSAADDSNELVVLLDEHVTTCGHMPKSLVHSKHTPLHLAFSCYVFDDPGRVLVTRRALTKQTWPGVWTNSFCGHPAPSEKFEDSVARRAQQELQTCIGDMRIAIPDFCYRATDIGGIVENEPCPVWTATISSDPKPSPAEVAEWFWMEWDYLVAVVDAAPFLFSPWARLQIPRLAAYGHPRETL